MQIAQVAPLTEAIPPKLYGGTERVISWLTSELVALGHEVDLFASGDSQTSAQLANGLTILTCCTSISITIRSPCFPSVHLAENVFWGAERGALVAPSGQRQADRRPRSRWRIPGLWKEVPLCLTGTKAEGKAKVKQHRPAPAPGAIDGPQPIGDELTKKAPVR
jgi:hypothetical protein